MLAWTSLSWLFSCRHSRCEVRLGGGLLSPLCAHGCGGRYVDLINIDHSACPVHSKPPRGCLLAQWAPVPECTEERPFETPSPTLLIPNVLGIPLFLGSALTADTPPSLGSGCCEQPRYSLPGRSAAAWPLGSQYYFHHHVHCTLGWRISLLVLGSYRV